MKRNQNTNFGFLIENQGKQIIYQKNLDGVFSGSACLSGNFSGTISGSANLSGNFTGSFYGYISGALIAFPIILSDLTHSVPLTMSSPFSSPPIAFIPYYVFSGTNQLNIDDCYFSNSISANSYYIQCNYNLPVGETLALVRTSSLSVSASAIEQVVTWQGVTDSNNDESPGTALSWSGATPTQIIVKEPGLYAVNGHASFASNATGGRAVYVSFGVTRMGANEGWNAGATIFTQIDAVATLPENAANTITMAVRQDSGGALNLNGGSTLTTRPGVSNRAYLQVTRIKNTSSPVGVVYGLLIRNSLIIQYGTA